MIIITIIDCLILNLFLGCTDTLNNFSEDSRTTVVKLIIMIIIESLVLSINERGLNKHSSIN